MLRQKLIINIWLLHQVCLLSLHTPTPNFNKIRQETRKLQVNINLRPYVKYRCQRDDFRGTHVCFTNHGITTSHSAKSFSRRKQVRGGRAGGRAGGWTDVVHIRQCFSNAGPRPGTGSWHQLYRAARGSAIFTNKCFYSGNKKNIRECVEKLRPRCWPAETTICYEISISPVIDK